MSYDTAKGVFHPTPSNEKKIRKIIRMIGCSFICIGLFLLIMIIWV